MTTAGEPMRPGANTTITHQARPVSRAVIGVAWRTTEPQLAQNMRLAAILCDDAGRALSAEDLVYVNQMMSSDLSVAHIARSFGDDVEQLELDLPSVPQRVRRIVVLVFINEGTGARRSLSQLRTCVIRLLDGDSGAEVAVSVDLVDHFTDETAAVLAEVYRFRGDWKFKVVGRGYANGVVGVAEQFGLPL